MRNHYQSLNYLDGQPGAENFRFTRTEGENGFLTSVNGVDDELDTVQTEIDMSRSDVEALRDMLNEVLEDWKDA